MDPQKVEMAGDGSVCRSQTQKNFYETYLSESAMLPFRQAVALRRPYFSRLIRDHFPADKNASVLDLGCGNGVLLTVATEFGYHCVSGVDLSSENVADARKNGLSSVKQGDLFDNLSGIDSASIDVVIAFDVIEHLKTDDAVKAVREVGRVLKRGGTFIMHVPNGASPFVGRVLYGDITHERGYTTTSVRQLLARGGFSDVKCLEDRPIPHGLKSAVRAMLWVIIRNTLRFCVAVESGITETGIFSQNLLVIARTRAS